MRVRRRWVILGIVLAGLTVSALAGLVATRYYPAYQSAIAARDDLREAQALLRDRRLDISVEDLATVEARLNDAERGFRHARRAYDDPLLAAGRRLPLLGGTLGVPIHITDIGIEAVRIGRETVTMARIFQELRDGEGGTLTERADEILAEMDPSIMAIKEGLSRIRQKRDQVSGVALPSALTSAIKKMDEELEELDELVRAYEDLSAFVPEFLGFSGSRTYLVLAQNNAELLPTGGLISVYGIITMEDGRIQEKYFEDAVSYGGRSLVGSDTYIEPPTPLRRYLLKDYGWNLAVSNWSPDFPTAAQDAERFFRLGGGRPVDGVIAINVRTIEELLPITGPITIESYGVTVTAENALDVIEEHTRTAQDPGTDRKALVGLLAEELLSRLMETPAERWMPLVDVLERLRDQRQILLFAYDPEMQSLVEKLELDGALETPDGDYFMLVDASVNSTKLNIVLDQRIDITVRIDAQGVAHHQVAVAYQNNLPAWAASRDPLLVRRLMLGGLYGGYVRLLAPDGSRLESVTLANREVGPEEISVEQGKAVFGRFFALPSGEKTELGYRYTTPGTIRLEDGLLVYRLYVQKQSGTGAIPVRLRLTLPAGASLHSVELDGEPVASLDDIETDVGEDRELIVRYELGR